MVWILVSVILASFVYITTTILTYSSFVSSARPRMGQLRNRIQQLEEGTATEERLNDVVEQRVKEEQMSIANLKLAVSETQQEIQAALARRKKIELQLFQQGTDLSEV